MSPELGIVSRRETPALVPTQPGAPLAGPLIRSFDDVMRIGQVIAASKVFPDVSDANRAAVKILAGLEIGLGPFAAMRGLHLMHGNAVPSGGVVAGLVRHHPDYDFDIVDLSDEQCVLRFYRRGKQAGDSSFTMGDAKKAGLVSDTNNWSKYPRNMLFSRAVTNGARWYCPDLTFDLSSIGDTDFDAATAHETRLEQGAPRRVMQGGWDAPADGEYWRRVFFGLVRGTDLDADEKRHEWLLETVGVNSLKAYLERATNADMRKLVEDAAYLTSSNMPTEVPTDEELTAGWERLGERPNPELANKRAQMDADWFEDEAPVIRHETSAGADAAPAATDWDDVDVLLAWDDVDAFVSGFRNRVRERKQDGPVEKATGLQVFDVMRAALMDNVQGTQQVISELAGRPALIKQLTQGEAAELLATASREGEAAWKAWCEAIVARRLAAEQNER